MKNEKRGAFSWGVHPGPKKNTLFPTIEEIWFYNKEEKFILPLVFLTFKIFKKIRRKKFPFYHFHFSQKFPYIIIYPLTTTYKS